MEGLNRVVRDTKHRKELVAGGLDEFLTEGVRHDFQRRYIINTSTEYCSLADRLGGRANDLWAAYFASLRSPTFNPMQLLTVPLQELPQVRILTYSTILEPHVFPDRFYTSGSQEASVDTCLPRFPPLVATVNRHICDAHASDFGGCWEHLHSPIQLAKTLRS